MQNKIFSN